MVDGSDGQRTAVQRTVTERMKPAQEPCAGLEFRVLGPVDVIRDGAPIALGGRKQLTVLAALLLAGQRVISDSRLIYLLWCDDPPTTMYAQVHTYISRLRKHLGDKVDIRRSPHGYKMDISSQRFDLHEFEQLSRQGREALGRGDYEQAAKLLHRGLAYWRGPALTDVTDNLASVELHRLEEARMVALESRIEADLALGWHRQLVPELTALAAEHPLRESLQAKLMIALYRNDRQSDALATFHAARRTLAEEVGADPGEVLYKTYRGVLNDIPDLRYPAGLRDQVTTSSPPVVGTLEITTPEPNFVGRDHELDRLRQVVLRCAPESHGVPVVSGMAGVGKTALATQTAYALRAPFPDGQLYVDFGAIADQSIADQVTAVLSQLLRMLKVDDADIPASHHERVQLYRSRLGSRRMLLVFDDATDEEQVRPLLPGSTCSRVIVTSRSRLTTLAGSELIHLDPLPRGDALALLTETVGDGRVSADPAAARRVVQLCGQLPLAIRSASVRMVAKPHWPLSRLANRLENECGRLRELRHATIDVGRSIGRSYERIDDLAQVALGRLSLLNVRDFPVWAVAAVLGTSSEAGEQVAAELVEANLLEAAQADVSGRPRYRVHELVRVFVCQVAADQ